MKPSKAKCKFLSGSCIPSFLCFTCLFFFILNCGNSSTDQCLKQCDVNMAICFLAGTDSGKNPNPISIYICNDYNITCKNSCSSTSSSSSSSNRSSSKSGGSSSSKEKSSDSSGSAGGSGNGKSSSGSGGSSGSAGGSGSGSSS